MEFTNALRALASSDLIRVAEDDTRPIEERAAACALLGERGSRDALPALFEIASQEHHKLLLWECFAAIGMIRSRTATRPLMTLIRATRSQFKRQAAVFALGHLSDQRALPLLTRVLGDYMDLEKTRGLAAEALGLLRPSHRSVNALIGALSDASIEVRYSALCGLTALRCEESLSAIRELSGDTAIVDGTSTLSDRALAAIKVIGESLGHKEARGRARAKGHHRKNGRTPR